MSRPILPRSIQVFVITLAVAGGASALQARRQTAQQAPPPPQTPVTPVASTPGLQAPADTSPARLGGIWNLNRELSTDTSNLLSEPTAGSAGSGGGRSGSGSGGGGRRGGGRGGYGGRSGSTTQSSSEQAVEARALGREVAEPPARITVVVADDTTTFTDDQGVVRKFTTSGKKESIDLGGAHVDSVSKWDNGVLTIELTAGSVKVTETYQVTVQGHEMVVEVKSTGGPRGGANAVPVKRIYDKANAG
jgi:hypothetical protein